MKELWTFVRVTWKPVVLGITVILLCFVGGALLRAEIEQICAEREVAVNDRNFEAAAVETDIAVAVKAWAGLSVYLQTNSGRTFSGVAANDGYVVFTLNSALSGEHHLWTADNLFIEGPGRWDAIKGERLFYLSGSRVDFAVEQAAPVAPTTTPLEPHPTFPPELWPDLPTPTPPATIPPGEADVVIDYIWTFTPTVKCEILVAFADGHVMTVEHAFADIPPMNEPPTWHREYRPRSDWEYLVGVQDRLGEGPHDAQLAVWTGGEVVLFDVHGISTEAVNEILRWR